MIYYIDLLGCTCRQGYRVEHKHFPYEGLVHPITLCAAKFRWCFQHVFNPLKDVVEKWVHLSQKSCLKPQQCDLLSQRLCWGKHDLPTSQAFRGMLVNDGILILAYEIIPTKTGPRVSHHPKQPPGAPFFIAKF